MRRLRSLRRIVLIASLFEMLSRHIPAIGLAYVLSRICWLHSGWCTMLRSAGLCASVLSSSVSTLVLLIIRWLRLLDILSLFFSGQPMLNGPGLFASAHSDAAAADSVSCCLFSYF